MYHMSTFISWATLSFMEMIHRDFTVILSALTVGRSAHSQGELTFECVTRGRSGCLHLVGVWITGPSRGWELCLVLGTSDWRARQEAKHWFLIDTLNSQTDCTTSGHEQNSMHNSVPQASREALSLTVISPSLFLDLLSAPQGGTFVVLSVLAAEKQSPHSRPALLVVELLLHEWMFSVFGKYFLFPTHLFSFVYFISALIGE